MAGLPGVKVGPLDPDLGERFGHVAKGPTARQLQRIHAQLHPQVLRGALARPLDHERTKGLVLDEVREYVGGLRLENGDPVVPEGARVVGAQVRGERDTEQQLTFTFLTKSGRTGKWFAPVDSDKLSESVAAGDELVKIAVMKERGVVSFDSEATQAEVLRRENARLRRENGALRNYREGKLGDDDVQLDEEHVDERPDTAIVAELEQLRRERESLVERVQQLEASRAEEATAAVRGEDPESQEPAASDPEPLEGYDKLNAHAVVARLKSEETSDEERQAILDYERSHADRRSVVGAAEESLGTRGEG